MCNKEALYATYDRIREAYNSIEACLLEEDWRHLANRGYPILAIKSYRQQHGGGLKEAKDMVDAFIKTIGI